MNPAFVTKIIVTTSSCRCPAEPWQSERSFCFPLSLLLLHWVSLQQEITAPVFPFLSLTCSMHKLDFAIPHMLTCLWVAGCHTLRSISRLWSHSCSCGCTHCWSSNCSSTSGCGLTWQNEALPTCNLAAQLHALPLFQAKRHKYSPSSPACMVYCLHVETTLHACLYNVFLLQWHSTKWHSQCSNSESRGRALHSECNVTSE